MSNSIDQIATIPIFRCHNQPSAFLARAPIMSSPNDEPNRHTPLFRFGEGTQTPFHEAMASCTLILCLLLRSNTASVCAFVGVFNAWTFAGSKDCHLPAQLKSFICCNPFLEFSQLFDYRVCGIMFRKSSRVSKLSNRRYWKEEVAHVFCFFSLFLHMHPRRSHILP